MQDDPPEDEPEESQSENSDVDDGDAVDISGIEIEVGNTDGTDSKGIEEPQRLVLDDSLTGELEHIVASDIFNDKSAQQDECLEIGWQRDAYDSDEKLTAHAEGEYHVNLGEFLNDVEDNPDAATMLGTANEFDLDAEGNKVVLDSGLNEIDPELEGSSQDGLEDKEDLMPFFSLFVYFISLMVISGVVFFISLFLL